MKTNLSIFFAALLLLSTSCEKDSGVISNIVQNEKDLDASAITLIGRQQVISLPTGSKTYPVSQALLWRPVSYLSGTDNSKRYPLIINLYGQGNCGTDLYKMLKCRTMSWYISEGFNATAKNPVDGKKYEFFVCSPQCPVSWGWSAPHVYNMLAQLKKSYPIDTTRIYITGFSCGGWGLWSCITDNDNLTKQFAAIIPISSASADHPNLLTNVGKYKIACLNICGDQDAFYPNAVKYTKIINADIPPIPARLITLPGVKHNAHRYAYDSTWKIMNTGINIYEWMLKHKRG